MTLVTDLIQAIENKDIVSMEKCLNALTNYQITQEDLLPIENLKDNIAQLLKNAKKDECFIDFGQEIYDKKTLDADYFFRRIVCEPFNKLIKLPFLKNDLAFLQKLCYEAYAKEMPIIHWMVLGELQMQYNHLVSFTEEDVKPNVNAVPLNFHYIWAGKTMPDEEVNNLSAMIAVAKKNNGKICLWTDNPTKQEGIFNLLPSSHHQYVDVKNILELYPLIDQHFDTKTAVMMKSFIQEEMEGFKNYAAMSDLVRMLVLYFHGGIYLDGDIHLQFNSERKIGSMDLEIAFKQLMSFHVYTPNTPSPRNDMLMSSAWHPILREALKMWAVLLHEQQTHALPHPLTNTTGFVPTYKDQRRFGQSYYENSKMSKPKEIGTGNLGVVPIDVALQGFIQKYNEVNQTQKTIKDCAFGYKMTIPETIKDCAGYKITIPKPKKTTQEIRLGNLVFDHIMAHKWLGDKKKRSIEV